MSRSAVSERLKFASLQWNSDKNPEGFIKFTNDFDAVNLAGVDVILNMRENMSRLQEEVGSLMTYVRDELLKNESELKGRFEQALVRGERGPLMVLERTTRITVRSSDEQTSGDAGKASNL